VFLEVSKAKYIGEYKINLAFNKKDSMVVDLSEQLEGEIFIPLKDLSFFKLFSIHYNTIEWSNGADFAPEFLYELGQKQASLNKISA
jgi:hypothetical protein